MAKITDKRSPAERKFTDIKEGAAFIYNEMLFMKLITNAHSNVQNAINLCWARGSHFDKHIKVVPVTVEINIYD